MSEIMMKHPSGEENPAKLSSFFFPPFSASILSRSSHREKKLFSDGGNPDRARLVARRAAARTMDIRTAIEAAQGKRALLVTAHPDDESMFFMPTILELRARGWRVGLLCLSNGDYDGMGRRREKELFAFAALLDLRRDDVVIARSAALRDGWERWDVDAVAEQVRGALRAERGAYDLLLTFDGRGVSGHPNHCSIYDAVARMAAAADGRSGCPAYALESMALPRKFLGAAEAILHRIPGGGGAGRNCISRLEALPWAWQALVRPPGRGPAERSAAPNPVPSLLPATRRRRSATGRSARGTACSSSRSRATPSPTTLPSSACWRRSGGGRRRSAAAFVF